MIFLDTTALPSFYPVENFISHTQKWLWNRVPKVSLSSDQKMPVLGLGTAAFLPVSTEVVVQAVLEAIEIGYRHSDTASLCQIESTLGVAIEEAVRLGLIKSRKELFITSKLRWNLFGAYKHKTGNLSTHQSQKTYFQWTSSLFGKPWKIAKRQGLTNTKSIGVSNFSSKELGDILTFATIPPAVNQNDIQIQSLSSIQRPHYPEMALYGVPEIALNSGQKMPVLGLGTGAFPPVAAEVFIQAVLQAIELGYRHFDTASLYQTESTLGTAIEEALRLGLVKSRDELFITSKLWGTDCHPQLVLPTLQKTLRELKLEYLDLFLIHWPISMKPGATEIPPKTEDRVPMDFKSVWEAMEDCQRQGLTKSIGISNFSSKKLGDILAFATIPPAVNQVELNPYWQQKKLRDYCKANGVTVAAFSPLGAPGNMWGSSRVMESEVLNEIAKAKGKSVAQVCLRWEYEQGIAIVIKSYNKERMKQNLEIFDWALSEEESKKISEISQSRRVTGEEFISATGPYKTLEELWDGEL